MSLSFLLHRVARVIPNGEDPVAHHYHVDL